MTFQLGVYKHFKGNEYLVINTAKHSETEEVHVIYKTLYGERDLWIRPLSMFTEIIEREGKRFPRFKYDRPKE